MFPSRCSWVLLIKAGELLWGYYCGGRDRLSPVCPASQRDCFEKLQMKSKQKAPDDRTYSLVSKCTKSFCTHSKESEVCPVWSYRGCLFFRSCKDFAFSLSIFGVKPAVGGSSASTMGECELCWAAVVDSQQTRQNAPSFLTPQSEPDNSPKPGRKTQRVLCLELLCSAAKLIYWEAGRWKAIAVRDLEIFGPVCFLVCMWDSHLGFHGGPRLPLF